MPKTILLIRNLKKRLKSLKILAFDTFLENFNGDNLGYESISDDTFADKLIEFESELPPFFSSSAKEISDYIKKELKTGSKVFICTNYPKRFSEILKEFEIYSEDIFTLPALTSGGGVAANVCSNLKAAVNNPQNSVSKWIFLSDKELLINAQKILQPANTHPISNLRII